MTWSPRLEVVQSTGSTNSDLVRAAGADPDAWPHLSALLAREQVAGRGRTDRPWDTTGMQAVTFSVVLRPGGEQARWGWLPLLAGLAVVRAIRAGAPASAGDRVMLKWPNDVVLAGGGTDELQGWGTTRKLGGILAEVLPGADGVVVGIGLNLQAAAVPVPWAATLAGAELVSADDGVASFTRADALVEAIGAELAALLAVEFQAGQLQAQVEAVCATLGQQVRVELPGGQTLTGLARELDDAGALVLSTEAGPRTVYAGDVRQLRGAAPA